MYEGCDIVAMQVVIFIVSENDGDQPSANGSVSSMEAEAAHEECCQHLARRPAGCTSANLTGGLVHTLKLLYRP